MKWYREENSRLVKAWESCAASKVAADKTVAVAPNGEYLILAAIGEIAKTTDESYTLPDLAMGIANEIEDRGWADLSFEDVAQELQELINSTLSGKREFFEELEIILVQNKNGTVNAVKRKNKAPVPALV